MSLIKAQDLSVGYDSHAVAEHITFELNAGDYLCIVGENGAGKSTLMKTLLGLQEPLGGELVLSKDIGARGIGYLPQQTVVQKDFPASVYEIVISGCQGRKGLKPFYDRQDRELAEANMVKMNISNLRNHCYRELSGGQQQRVLLARALCAVGRVILLDEPAAGLDPGATEDMYRTIADLNSDGMTVIMISHDLDAALRYADHILMLGRDSFFGTPDEFKRNVRQWGFGVKGGQR